MWFTGWKLLFCSFLASHFRTDWECCYWTKPATGLGYFQCTRWVDQLSFTNVVLFIKKRWVENGWRWAERIFYHPVCSTTRYIQPLVWWKLLFAAPMKAREWVPAGRWFVVYPLVPFFDFWTQIWVARRYNLVHVTQAACVTVRTSLHTIGSTRKRTNILDIYP